MQSNYKNRRHKKYCGSQIVLYEDGTLSDGWKKEKLGAVKMPLITYTDRWCKWNSPIYQDAVKKQSESTQDLQEEIEIKNDSLDNR